MSNRAAIVIPARYASSRLPGKPLISLLGKTLIQRVYENAMTISGVGQVIVATDDERIMSAVAGFGGAAVMTPSDLATGSERVGFVARELKADIIVNLQGDEPLVSASAIEAAVAAMDGDEHLQVATLAAPLLSATDWENPDVVKVVVDSSDYALYFSRAAIPHPRDDGFEPLEQRLHHIGVYVYRRDFLLDYLLWEEGALERVEKLEQLRILERGYRIKVFRAEEASPGVDTAADVEAVENILRKRG